MKKEEITLKNTKAEILEALNQALEREKNINKTKSDPQKEEVERKKKESISESKENIKQNIFSDELITKFKNLEMAIEALEEKLKNLYGLEGELNNFTLVVNAEKDFLADLEIKKKVEIEKLETSIQELEAEYKKKNCKKLIVCGCLAQRYKEDLEKEMPEVDRFIAIREYPQLHEILKEELQIPLHVYGKSERLSSGKPWTAYLKIAEGCSNRCTYCAIPLIRGENVSVPMEDLVGFQVNWKRLLKCIMRKR